MPADVLPHAWSRAGAAGARHGRRGRGPQGSFEAIGELCRGSLDPLKAAEILGALTELLPATP